MEHKNAFIVMIFETYIQHTGKPTVAKSCLTRISFVGKVKLMYFYVMILLRNWHISCSIIVMCSLIWNPNLIDPIQGGQMN